MTPQRIQRKRTKGWRMPEGAIYVGRPSKWGNPFTVVNAHRQGWLIYDDTPGHRSEGFIRAYTDRAQAQAGAVELFKLLWRKRHPFDLLPLGGYDLACWCKPDESCHADVLLKLANRPVTL